MRKTFKIEYNPETLQLWQDSIEALQLFDANFSQQLIKPSNLIDYLLSTIELMTQVKQYNQDSFVIALINYAEICKKKPRIFMTQFIRSYQEHANEAELAYLTQLLSALEHKTSQMFKFYLKVRKYIFSNYVNPRESYIKPIKFDDWVTIVARFLDNQAIAIIGTRIKEELNNSSTEKVFKNTVQPLELLIFCYELYENKCKGQIIKQEQSIVQQEEELTAQTKKSAQQLAYRMIMDSPGGKGQQTSQTEQLQKNEKFKQVIQLHGNLAYNYKILANYVTDTQEFIKTVLLKVINQSIQNKCLDEVSIQQIEQIINFKSFSQSDAIEELHDSQIYDII